MGKEIERKFLVTDASYRSMASHSLHIVQTYLNSDPDCTIRLRTIGSKAFITIKSRNEGAVRGEWEYEIPLSHALEIMQNCKTIGTIDKTRFFVPAGVLVWEVDEFHGALTPLVLAEIELPEENTQLPQPIPSFIGEEVTGNPEYYNSALAAKA